MPAVAGHQVKQASMYMLADPLRQSFWFRLAFRRNLPPSQMVEVALNCRSGRWRINSDLPQTTGVVGMKTLHFINGKAEQCRLTQVNGCRKPSE